MMRRVLFALATLVALPLSTFAAAGSTEWQGVPGIEGDMPVIQTRLVASRTGGTQPLTLAWEFDMQPDWHIYWQNPGDSGLAPELKGPQGYISLTFPTPEVIALLPITNYGYKNKVTLTAPYTPTKAGPQTFAATFLYCKDICLPGTINFTLPLETTATPNAAFTAPAQPQEALAATASQANDVVTLTLPFAAEGTHFIPDTDGLIDDSAAQITSGNMLTFPLDNQSLTKPTQLKGLLLKDGKGYIIDTPLPVGTPISANASPSFGLPAALFFAFMAGLILNLMPCVLPVLSLKLLSLVRHHHGHNRLNHTLAYTGGVVGTFWAFAAAIGLIQAGGTTLGWGFHLQSPMVVGVLTLLMLGVALNFWGVFSLGESLTRLGSRSTEQSLISSIATGALAVIVATPCTVPFMGGAMAYALTQPFAVTLLVFTLLGLGMAAPFLLIAAFPQLLKRLPKPGVWMNTFRHALGWPMLATALWLAFVFTSLTSQLAGFALLGGALALALALWIYGQRPRWWAIGLIALAIIATLMGVRTLNTPSTTHWQPWSADTQAAALAKNAPVFVDFTADWCLTCKVTEATVLNTQAAQRVFEKHNVTLLQADWTRQNPAITAELAKHGRKGVPLYLLYTPGNPTPQILPQLLTVGVIEAALTQ